MIFDILSGIFGTLVFIFIFWRKLREDYAAGEIFNSAFWIIIAALAAAFLAGRLLRPWWFWASFAGVMLGLVLTQVRYKFRFFETFEAVVIGLLPFLALVFLADSIKTSSIFSFSAFVFMTLLMGLYYYLDKHYKSFSWYRSGRIGFSGLTVAAIFFLARALFASIFPFVLSFVSSYETVLSSVAAFIFFLLTFNLARQET